MRHGRYSRYLPEALAEKFAAAKEDPDLFSLSDDVAVVQALIESEFERLKVDAAASSENWKKALAYYRTVVAQGSKPAGVEAMRALGVLLEEAGDVGDVARIVELLERKKRLVEAHAKREERLGLVLSVREVETFVTRLVSEINAEFKAEPERAERLSARISALL